MVTKYITKIVFFFLYNQRFLILKTILNLFNFMLLIVYSIN